MVVKSLRRFSGAELADQSIETENNITSFISASSPKFISGDKKNIIRQQAHFLWPVTLIIALAVDYIFKKEHN